MELLIDNRAEGLQLTDEIIKDLELAVSTCLRNEKKSEDYEVSLSFVDEEEIRDLNHAYRNVDQVTDVLSFPLEEDFAQMENMLGDIVICYSIAQKQADRLGHSLRRELVYLTVHSMFHLMGYDHMDPDEKTVMRAKEKEVIRILGIYKSKEKVVKKNRRTPVISGLNHAIDGLIFAVKNEYNMRVHFVTAVLVIVLATWFNLSRMEMAMLCLTITLVILAEFINTAIEYTVDLVSQEYNFSAKIAKDVAAGGVLVAALCSLIVGYFLFVDKVLHLSLDVFKQVRRSSSHQVFVIIVLILLLTVLFKSMFFKGRGTHVQGGAVSGHASVSFAIATIIGFLTNNSIVVILGFVLAFLVSESRVEGKIHDWAEVLMGAILGITATILMFKLVMGG
ncbi:MAG: rRNA maturation RNase YbeY [Tissierellia bacterium]|nr:rRNA maturation RNase YbeY [Tissierellia bacterium]